MTQYTALQGQAAVVTFLALASLVALTLTQRRVVAPLVAFGIVILLARGVGFVLGYFGSGGEAPPGCRC